MEIDFTKKTLSPFTISVSLLYNLFIEQLPLLFCYQIYNIKKKLFYQFREVKEYEC